MDDLTKKALQETREALNLSQFVIEKDYHVTKAIHVLSEIKNDYYELVFQGGTSLAKGHRIIERMSEDCDFRIRATLETQDLSKEAKRRKLRAFRREITQILTDTDYHIEDDSIRTRNEGQFMFIPLQYPVLYPEVQSMKPYLSLEFFLAEVKTPTVNLPITTLIKQTLGELVNHDEKPIECVSILETAAEKWVALTRRIATIKFRSHYRDSNLVRHLYDLYQIHQTGALTGQFAELAASIVLDDQKQYKNHNPDYLNSAADEIKRSIDILNNDPAWKESWTMFIEDMVYQADKPTYSEVLDNLMTLSSIALPAIEAQRH